MSRKWDSRLVEASYLVVYVAAFARQLTLTATCSRLMRMHRYQTKSSHQCSLLLKASPNFRSCRIKTMFTWRTMHQVFIMTSAQSLLTLRCSCCKAASLRAGMAKRLQGNFHPKSQIRATNQWRRTNLALGAIEWLISTLMRSSNETVK